MSWYRTGTINLTKDSANVTGVNTKWAQAVNGVMSGMMVIMPDGKLYEIKNVVSDTSLVLVTAYAGATAAGQAYAVVTTYEGDLSQFSARFSALLTALGGSRADLYNWLTSTAATITISKDDGTTSSVKTLKAFSDEQATFAKKGKNSDITELTGLTTALSIAQGGTGATDAAGIRKNAGLGTAATKDVGTAAGNVMQVGTFGLGGQGMQIPNYDYNLIDKAGFYSGPGGAGQSTVQNAPSLELSYGAVISAVRNNEEAFTIVALDKRITFRPKRTGVWGNYYDFYTTANTTKGSDGTLKSASPVIRIVKDAKTCQRDDIDEDGFEWCGSGVANGEAAGIEIIREDIGVYRVTGAISLATSGWRLLPPRDPNGSGDLGVVTAEEREDEIIITLFRRKMVLEEGEIVIKAGEPIDVPANSWIDVRLEMPAQTPQIEPEQ